MTKTPTIFNINNELLELIKKKPNRSEWANQVFRERLEKEELELMDEEALLRYIAREEAKEEYEAKLKEIDNGNFGSKG